MYYFKNKIEPTPGFWIVSISMPSVSPEVIHI